VRLAELERLDGLALHVRRGMGDRPGERRFPGRPQASGIEVESHVAYAPGDDLRHLDWNALGRLDTLLVRRFTAEREVVVHLLLDASASMGVPAPDRKLAVACDLALALGYLALVANDAVRLTVLADDGLTTSPVLRQRRSVARLGTLLDAVRARGAVALGAALARHAREHAAPGVAIVISDLMLEPPALEEGLLALRARRYEVLLLHVLGRGEVEPERHFGAGILADVESGATHPVALTRATLARYRDLLGIHLDAVAAVAARSEAVYARLPSDGSVRDFVAIDLPRLGVVRRR